MLNSRCVHRKTLIAPDKAKGLGEPRETMNIERFAVSSPLKPFPAFSDLPAVQSEAELLNQRSHPPSILKHALRAHAEMRQRPPEAPTATYELVHIRYPYRVSVR